MNWEDAIRLQKFNVRKKIGYFLKVVSLLQQKNKFE